MTQIKNAVLPMGKAPQRDSYCCETMEQQLKYHCKQHGDGPDCPDVIVSEEINGFILWGRNMNYLCDYCPWCGERLNEDVND
jgi:hypothetical protein